MDDSSAHFAITLNSRYDEDGAMDPMPISFSAVASGSFLEVDISKTEAHYTGPGNHGHDVGAVQANCAAPRDQSIYYYEVTIVSAGESGKIGIGFGDATFKLSRQPGWEPHSFGYHGDDGALPPLNVCKKQLARCVFCWR